MLIDIIILLVINSLTFKLASLINKAACIIDDVPEKDKIVLRISTIIFFVCV